MLADQEFLLSKIMDLNTQLSAISLEVTRSMAGLNGKLDGFMSAQTQAQSELTSQINTLVGRISAAEEDISVIKTQHSDIKNRLLGAAAICSAIGVAFSFVWPFVQAAVQKYLPL
jgi:chromosome segregation ATPase